MYNAWVAGYEKYLVGYIASVNCYSISFCTYDYRAWNYRILVHFLYICMDNRI